MRKNKFFIVFFFFIFSTLLFSNSSYRKGLKYLKKGNLALAKEQFLNVIKNDKSSSYKLKAELRLIDCNTNYFDTLIQLKSFLKRYPQYNKKAEIHYKLGNLYYLHNNLDSAEEQFSIITNKYKNTKPYFSALYWLGNIYVQNRFFKKATHIFNLILHNKEYNTYQPLASLRIADINFYQKKFYSAITNYKRTLNNYRTSSVKLESYFFLAQSYEMVKDYQNALYYYTKVLKKYKKTQFADLSREKIKYLQKKEPKLLQKKKRLPKPKKQKTTHFFYVQVGNFVKLSSSNELRLFLKKQKFPVFFKKIKTNNQYHYKVWIGPYKTKTQATKIKQQLKSSYKLDAFIVQD